VLYQYNSNKGVYFMKVMTIIRKLQQLNPRAEIRILYEKGFEDGLYNIDSDIEEDENGIVTLYINKSRKIDIPN
jgi:hypothetical protein